MEEYEFPIPTSHIRAEEISRIGKTDTEFVSENVLNGKALQIYKIYTFSTYQKISESHTDVVYIIPKR